MESDPILEEGFRRRDPEAIARIKSVVGGIVAHKGYFIPVPEREDVVQAALADVWKELQRPNFKIRESFVSFVREVALRKCVDWIRRRRRMRDAETDGLMTEHANGPVTFAASTNPGPDEEFFRQERLAIKDQVLRMLREPCRELIRLCVDEGLDYREVARRQNRSYDAVRRQWCDCLKEATRLREAAERLVREPGGRVR